MPLVVRYSTNGCCRRILSVPTRSGGGLLTERTPAVQPRRREWAKVPHRGHCLQPVAGSQWRESRPWETPPIVRLSTFADSRTEAVQPSNHCRESPRAHSRNPATRRMGANPRFLAVALIQSTGIGTCKRTPAPSSAPLHRRLGLGPCGGSAARRGGAEKRSMIYRTRLAAGAVS